jgi:DNA-binding transcriptional LysR family regulator
MPGLAADQGKPGRVPGAWGEVAVLLLRHLETLVAIAEEGSFTAAADALNTVQSNVSDQVRQLELELGVPLLVRGRRGAEPTEFGVVVLERARRVQRELESMRADLSMIQGLEAGSSRLGVVGTASRWLAYGCA